VLNNRRRSDWRTNGYSKTLVVISYLDFPFYAGLSVRMNGLTMVLRKHGIQVKVFAPIFRLDKPMPSESGCEIEHIDMRSLRRLGSEKLLVKLLADAIFSLVAFAKLSVFVLKGVRLVQYQSLYSAMPAILTKIFWGGKVIGDDIVLHLSKNKLFYPLTYFLNHLVLRLTDVVATASPYAYAFTKGLFSKKTVIFVPNGVQLAQMDFVGGRKILSNRIIFVGSLSFEQNLKAVENLLEIASGLDERKIDFQILVVGGPIVYVKHLFDHPIVKKGNISFLGHTSPRKLQELYHSSLVGLLPFFEDTPLVGGQRMKALEYFANGLLVVSGPSGVKGIVDLKPGIHYISASSVAETVEILSRLLAGAEGYERIAQGGQRLILQNHSWETVTRDYLKIIKSLAAGCENRH